jgi:hypothetical protein
MKITAGVAGAALAVAAAGTAYAFWSTDGAGNTSATAATSNGALVLSAVALTAVTPGTNYSVPIKASNAGTTDLRVDNVATTITSNIPACSTLIGSVAGPTFDDLSTATVNVPAGTLPANAVTIGTGSFNWLNSATVNQNACKGAIFTLTFAGTSV